MNKYLLAIVAIIGVAVFGVCGMGNVVHAQYFSPTTLSQTSLSLVVGQTSSVTMYGSGSYYVSNSNQSVAYASIVNTSTLNVYGSSAGTATFTVCSSYSGSSCANLYVTVSGNSNNSNQSYWTVNVGQSENVTITGAGSYQVTNSDSSIVYGYMANSNNLSITGVSAGTADVTVCSQVNNSCAILVVTVPYTSNYYNYNNNYWNYSSPVYLNQSSVSLSVGRYSQSSSVTIYGGGGNGSYYLSNNSNSYVASAYVGSNTVNVSAMSAGTTTITVCSSTGGSSCATLYVTVTNPAPIYPVHPVHPTQHRYFWQFGRWTWL